MTTTDKYHPGKSIQQLFEYGGGQRFLTGGYFNYPLWPGNDNTMFCGSYISPHQLVNGANHGYSNVTITTKNESGQMLSKKELVYSNFYDAGGKGLSYYTAGKNYFEPPYTDKQYIKDWELGLLLSSREYDQNGNILTSTVNTYDFKRPIVLSNIGSLGTSKTLNVVDDNGAFVSIASDQYRHFTGFAPLTKTVSQKYVSDVSFISDEATFVYDAYKNLKTTTTKDSRGVYSLLWNTYNYDVLQGTLGGDLSNMNVRGYMKVISTLRWKMAGPTATTQDYLLDGSITRYKFDGNKLLNQKQFTLQSLEPIPHAVYYPASFGYGPVLTAYNSPNSPLPGFYVLASEVMQTNAKAHATEMKYMGQNIYSALIWDINENIAATVSNARLADVGFTSFESDIYNDPIQYTGSAEITNGRFSYKKSGMAYIGSKISGKTYYKLGPGSYIKTPSLTSGQSYVLTFWSNGGVPAISGVGATLQPEMQYELSNGWKFYKATFTTSAAGILTFSSGATINMDELRLFPSDATMVNSVYTPLFGVTSTTDATGRITYYEYDGLGRQTVTKDQEGNVVSKTEIHIGQ
jgi:YD repeat-containing protein